MRILSITRHHEQTHPGVIKGAWSRGVVKGVGFRATGMLAARGGIHSDSAHSLPHFQFSIYTPVMLTIGQNQTPFLKRCHHTAKNMPVDCRGLCTTSKIHHRDSIPLHLPCTWYTAADVLNQICRPGIGNEPLAAHVTDYGQHGTRATRIPACWRAAAVCTWDCPAAFGDFERPFATFSVYRKCT